MKTKATKAHVGLVISVVGTGVTSALAFAAPGSALFAGLTIASAMITAGGVWLGVYKTTNEPVDS